MARYKIGQIAKLSGLSHRTIRYYEEMGLLPEAEKYKSYLRTAAEVYDMEFPNSFTENDDNFYDGFHLPNTVKPYLVELIFTDVQADCIRRTKP